MRPSLDEACYHVALEMLSEETGRSQSELAEEIETEAKELRSR